MRGVKNWRRGPIPPPPSVSAADQDDSFLIWLVFPRYTPDYSRHVNVMLFLALQLFFRVKSNLTKILNLTPPLWVLGWDSGKQFITTSTRNNIRTREMTQKSGPTTIHHGPKLDSNDSYLERRQRKRMDRTTWNLWQSRLLQDRCLVIAFSRSRKTVKYSAWKFKKP